MGERRPSPLAALPAPPAAALAEILQYCVQEIYYTRGLSGLPASPDERRRLWEGVARQLSMPWAVRVLGTRGDPIDAMLDLYARFLAQSGSPPPGERLDAWQRAEVTLNARFRAGLALLRPRTC